MSKMAQSNMHKTNLNLTVMLAVVPRWSNLLSLLCFLTANICFYVWLLKSSFLYGDELMIGEILTKWHDIIQSFLGFLQYGSASLVKSTMPVSCPQKFPAIGQKIFWFLMELSLNPKSQTLGLSFLAPIALCADLVIFKCVLRKPFCQNIFDMILQKKLNSFYDRLNCSF